MSIDLSADILARLWPDAPRALRDAVVSQWPEVCAKRGITSRRRAIYFLGNISHESDGGTIRRESMRYSAERIVQVFGKNHSANVGWMEARQLAADAKKTGGVALAERVYGLGNPHMAHDLGNTEPGDGWAFRGGGGSQTTGRAAYALAEQRSGLPLLEHPDLIADPGHWLDIAAADFGDCRRDGKTCLEWADEGNDEMVCRALNGGVNGLASRREWTAQWDRALSRDGSAIEPAADPTVQYGDRGWQVEALQRRLAALGYPVGKIDGAFGDATRAAVLDFQAREGLATDGSVGPATRARLGVAVPREVSTARAAATVADVADHPAIAAATATATLAKRSGLLAAAGAVVDGMKDDPVAAVQSGLDKVQQAKGLMGQVSDLAGGVIGWVGAHPVACLSLAVAAVCALAVMRANGTVAAVVERYRAGLDMG